MCEGCGEGSGRPDVETETGVMIDAVDIGIDDGFKLVLGLFD